jgi:hypothetical protein
LVTRDVGFAAIGVKFEDKILVTGPHGANDLLSIPSSINPLIETFGSNSSRFELAWSVGVSCAIIGILGLQTIQKGAGSNGPFEELTHATAETEKTR